RFQRFRTIRKDKNRLARRPVLRGGFDRPFARFRAREDRHFETAVIGSPLHVPLAMSLAVLEQECRFSLWFAHLAELTPPPAAPQLGIDEARRSGRLRRWERYGLRCGRLRLVEDLPQPSHARRQGVAVTINRAPHQGHDFGIFFGG